jgi:ubiquinol-cytochrome c reductase iron-sulfur subunit
MTGRRGAARRGRGIALGFGASALASIGLMVVYFLGGQVQLEGALLGVALGGIALGLIVWAKEMMPGGPFVEQRKLEPAQPGALAETEADLDRAEEGIERRGFLVKMLGAALGALGVAALFPIRSLGSRPGNALFRTSWAPGARLVTLDGVPVRPRDLDIGGVLTVFPEQSIDAADSQVLLIRLEEGVYRPPPGRKTWSPQGFVAFSKVCTHAGCPVGLYQPTSNELFCPCHQSVFAVLEAARPTSGPATRPLPQLPLSLNDDGYFVAQSDFTEPVGPGFWSRPGA